MGYEKNGKKKIGRVQRFWGLASLVLMIASGMTGIMKMERLHILPEQYISILKLSGVILVILVILMQFHKRIIIAGIVISFFSAAAMGAVSYYVSVSDTMLQEITQTSTSVASVGLYVKEDDSAQTIGDIAKDKIGILKNLDRDNTDAALSKAQQDSGIQLEAIEYEGVIEMTKGLNKGDIRGMLVNSAYLSLLDETEDMAGCQQNVRLLWSHEIERALEIDGMSEGKKPDIKEQPDSGTEETVKTKKTIDDSQKKTEENTEKTEDAITETPFIVYLSGNDSEGELHANGRSDVNILMAVNPRKNEILLVNTPRDYYVTLAGIGEKDKLTHAGIYGVDTSMNTLADLYNVKISYYVRLNFSGFMDIIDALGGITVVSDVEFTVADWHYVVGENELSGIEALAFARERYSFADGDRQRGRNQQAVIKGIIKKVCSPVILTNYAELMDAASGAVETNMSKEEIAALVKWQLQSGGNWTVDSVSADGAGETGPCYSTPGYNCYRMIPDVTTVQTIKEKLKKSGF